MFSKCCFNASYTFLTCCVFVFINSQYILTYFVSPPLDYKTFKICYVISKYTEIFSLYFCFWLLLILSWLENMLYMTSIFLNLLELASQLRILLIWINVPCVLNKNVYSTMIRWSILQMSFRPSYFIGIFKASISALIFWPLFLLITGRGTLKCLCTS